MKVRNEIEASRSNQLRRHAPWRKEMQAKMARVLYAIVGGLLLVLPSVGAFAVQVNVLLIHGRLDPNSINPHEQYGWPQHDQAQYWQNVSPVTSGKVYYVQWDAWNRGFDDTHCPGGKCMIETAVNSLCDISHGQECWIICHSAGCAAFENYLAKSDYATNNILIAHVMAAGSAAGGSELADQVALNALDRSLTTSYARNAYQHNNMQGVVIRALAGTNNDVPALQCLLFPRQSGSGLNQDCTLCLAGTRECSDGAVPLHSACGHNRAASFQDCNSTLPPNNDAAGTYDFHGWWIADQYWSGASGPYNTKVQALFNRGFRTYRADHGRTAVAAIQEYTSAPVALCP